MYKVKVIGAGSIGNHLANAARAMKWDVDICDIDEDALNRTKNDIYPARYGRWDEGIGLYKADNVPTGGYDMIFIGTPPDSHNELAIKAVNESPKVLLIEKPVCDPDLEQAQALIDLCKENNILAFTGYDHVVGKACEKASELMKTNDFSKVETLDVEIREHWGGIFGAHPWLSGPSDSYLGYWKRGGGACGEHSHGINLWQHFSHEIGGGRVTEVSASLEYVKDNSVDYDKICFITLKTEYGLCGRVVQDVVTQPPRKYARLQCTDNYVEWYCNYKPGVDVVKLSANSLDAINETDFKKTRPDDFIQEMKHIQNIIDNGGNSPISLERGMDTMLVIAAAHKSSQEKRPVTIDYSKGYIQDALV